MSLLVARPARRDLDLEALQIPGRGRIVLRSFTEARHLAHALSAAAPQGRPPTATDLAALSILDRAFRVFLAHYVSRRDGALLRKALEFIGGELGLDTVERELMRFAEAFALAAWDDGDGSGKRASGDQEMLLLELVLYWLQEQNRAAAPIVGALHRGFEPSASFRDLLAGLERFLGGCDGELEGSLLDDLLSPLRAHPDSLVEQLLYLRRRWEAFLGEELWRIQGVLDVAAEESAPRWGFGGSPKVEVGVRSEGERRYSDDRDWMPHLVLVAKNTLVWLDQLSRAYGRDIRRLDQIPDAELELLAGRGLTGLWLIGLWQRSEASREIKRRRGNPEAAASAYALRAYRIAPELGGEEALQDLRHRAARFGVRLAADMVPNHMGIDSDWVLDHPGRFVQAERPPYPAYSFTGPDLSDREGVTVQIEDHYYDASDAAVVFRRHEHSTGAERFVYHGNDGTSTPWNDTAQLDYLQAETRDAVMATILDVARRFSVIRFDAAMTLTKRHYQRLWHPQPGDAGAIPSRAEHGMTREAFDRLMPKEFWREVVDRVAEEAPDTLLLAEAFWLMEGYFVRTLGMHRVYNSAFMHMLRDRETGKFRHLLKETLAFDPEILRRYVNFMSNPDEEPAAAQFGDGDRYFGVCVILATLPGLPMFAHGQWDGMREKYGMEYLRAYHEEAPGRDVIERHDRQLAPLLRERARFAGVRDFRLYDFHDGSGVVNDCVLAYSNGTGADAVLVAFNNSPDRVRGRLDDAAPFRRDGSSEALSRERLPEILALGDGERRLCRFRDRQLGLDHLQPMSRLNAEGLQLTLDGFQCVVLDGFHTYTDDAEQNWKRLAEHLDGRGVPDLRREMLAVSAAPLRAALRGVEAALSLAASTERSPEEARGSFEHALGAADRELAGVLARPPVGRPTPRAGSERSVVETGLEELLGRPAESAGTREATAAADACRRLLAESALLRSTLAVGLVVERAARALGGETLQHLPSVALEDAPVDNDSRRQAVWLAAAASRLGWYERVTPPGSDELAVMVENWIADDDVRQALGCHDADGVEWMVQERLESFLEWRGAIATLSWLGAQAGGDRGEGESAVVGWNLALRQLGRVAERAGYRVRWWAREMRSRGSSVEER